MDNIRYRKLELNSRRKEVLKVKYDFDKVRGRIREKLGSEAKFAEKLGISSASLSSKFNNRSDFSANEISRATDEDVLDIKINEIGEYFFTKKLELNSRKTFKETLDN